MRIFVACWLILLLTACLGGQVNGSALKEESYRFTESMRWHDFDGAAKYVAPDQQQEFFSRFPQDNEDLKIVESQIEAVEINEANKTAVISYELEYYRLPSSRVKKWRWTQHWRQNGEKEQNPGLWRIVNPPPPLP